MATHEFPTEWAKKVLTGLPGYATLLIMMKRFLNGRHLGLLLDHNNRCRVTPAFWPI